MQYMRVWAVISGTMSIEMIIGLNMTILGCFLSIGSTCFMLTNKLLEPHHSDRLVYLQPSDLLSAEERSLKLGVRRSV